MPAAASTSLSTLSSRDLNQDVGRAKRAALRGPVIITDRGKPSHVLLSIAQYRKLQGRGKSLVEALSMPGLSTLRLPLSRSRLKLDPADLD